MTGNDAEQRVKLCLSCDDLIPYEAEICPSCKNSQILGEEKDCPICSTRLHEKALFCPKCDHLAVTLEPNCLPEDQDISQSKRTGAHYKISIWALSLLALIVQLWLIVDYLVLN